VFAAPWSSCTKAYAMLMRYISEENVQAFFGGLSAQLSEWLFRLHLTIKLLLLSLYESVTTDIFLSSFVLEHQIEERMFEPPPGREIGELSPVFHLQSIATRSPSAVPKPKVFAIVDFDHNFDT
jgi:hypothetical protein